MDELRHLTGFLVIAAGAAVLALSYVAVYLIGKNNGRREAGDPGRLGASPADRVERIESAVDAIAVEIERLAEGQRFLLGPRRADADSELPAVIRPQPRHTTPV